MPNTDRENPWSPWVSWYMPGTFAHPDAPAGGMGLGYSREVGPSGTDIHGGRTPDPHSPVGQKVTPWDAAVEYAKFELERARAQLFDARSWETLRIVAEQALGPKSFGLGACYGIVKNPAMSVAGLLQLMRTLIEADLYERLTQRVTWRTMLKPGGGMGLPKLSDVGYLLAMQSGLLNIADLKKSYETREALIANVEELIKHPIDAVGKMAGGIKEEYVAKWNRFRELQKHTDLKSQFEAGEIFGDVLMEVVMVVLTVISVGGAAAKLAAKVPQLARLAEVVKGARTARAGGVAAEGAEIADAAKTGKISGSPTRTPVESINAKKELPKVPDKVAAARLRQEAMLNDDIGYNISPTDWDSYPSIGRNGTFVTDKKAVTDALGNIEGKSQMTLTKAEVARIESGSGLEPGSLQNGFKVRKVTGIGDAAPRSPLEGNKYFAGPGNHLPSGAPEMVVKSIPTTDNAFTTTILEVKVIP